MPSFHFSGRESTGSCAGRFTLLNGGVIGPNASQKPVKKDVFPCFIRANGDTKQMNDGFIRANGDTKRMNDGLIRANGRSIQMNARSIQPFAACIGMNPSTIRANAARIHL